MATIGTFTKSGDTFTGSVKTLSINAKTTIKAADKSSDKAPTTASSPAPPSSGRPGRRPRTRAAPTARSSSTTRASRLRSMPPWSRASRPTASA